MEDKKTKPGTPLERVLSHGYKQDMVGFVEKHPEVLAELIDLSVSDKPSLNWRAAWLLYSVIDQNNLMVKTRLDEIIASIPDKEPNHQRELMRVMLKVDFNEAQEGKAYDLAVGNWERIGLKPAVRYIAFRVILKVVEKYPELKDEVKLLTQEHYLESLSPGIRHSIHKMLDAVTK